MASHLYGDRPLLNKCWFVPTGPSKNKNLNKKQQFTFAKMYFHMSSVIYWPSTNACCLSNKNYMTDIMAIIIKNENSDDLIIALPIYIQWNVPSNEIFKWIWPSKAISRQTSRSPLVYLMAWHLFDARLLPEPVLNLYEWNMISSVSVKQSQTNHNKTLGMNNGIYCIKVGSCYGVVIIRHDDVIKWKHFPRYWPFVRGIHRPPVTRSFDVDFDLRVNKWLSKQSWGWWFETRSRPLWRHYNGYI